jgi:hypothetical protein
MPQSQATTSYTCSRLKVVAETWASQGFQLSLGETAMNVPNPFNRDIFYDEYGLIVHKNPDGKFNGGDTAQREGWYWLGVWIRQNTPGLQAWTPKRALNFDQVLHLLEPDNDGVFYRHPKQPPFNNPRDKEWGFSRDQLEPLVAAMGVWGKHEALHRLWDRLPGSLLGRHAFNGNWRNLLGQDGRNCDEIKERVCTLKVDNRDCSLKVDTRDCSLKVDTRDCSLKVDTRSCGHDIETPLGKIHVNDPVCEAAKAAQNAAYKAEHDACEAAKALQNALYKAEHDKCEAEKAAQNLKYKAEHDACEAAKAAQNALYEAEYKSCLAQKEADHKACLLSNVHSGDLIGPMTVNLYRRAFGAPSDWFALGGLAGELELLANVQLRLGAARASKDDVGDDLNLIVRLLMAKLRCPSAATEEASRVYSTQREHPYGSYLDNYRAQFGDDLTDFDNRVRQGVRGGWGPNISAVKGAILWYHRPSTGANPQLAELYFPIIDRFIK